MFVLVGFGFCFVWSGGWLFCLFRFFFFFFGGGVAVCFCLLFVLFLFVCFVCLCVLLVFHGVENQNMGTHRMGSLGFSVGKKRDIKT